MKRIIKAIKDKGFTIQEISQPLIIKGKDVKIKMLYSGICGTDYHIEQWDEWAQQNIKVPHVNGHEGVGRIVGIGSDVKNLKVGDLVAFEAHVFDETCQKCLRKEFQFCENMKVLGINLDGIWSEYVVLPEKMLFPVGNSVPLRYLSLLDPLGNAHHLQSGSKLEGKSVLVMGDGPIGLMTALIVQASQPKNVFLVGINQYRLKIAKKCGLKTINSLKMSLTKAIEKLTDNEGIDIVLEASGSVKALKDSIKLINPGGDLNVLSLYPANEIMVMMNELVKKNLKIQTVFGRKIWETWEQSYQLLVEKIIPWKYLDQLITHQVPMVNYDKGMKLIASKEAMKVLLVISEKDREELGKNT